jgi:hypothetical protein
MLSASLADIAVSFLNLFYPFGAKVFSQTAKLNMAIAKATTCFDVRAISYIFEDGIITALRAWLFAWLKAVVKFYRYHLPDCSNP